MKQKGQKATTHYSFKSVPFSLYIISLGFAYFGIMSFTFGTQLTCETNILSAHAANRSKSSCVPHTTNLRRGSR